MTIARKLLATVGLAPQESVSVPPKSTGPTISPIPDLVLPYGGQGPVKLSVGDPDTPLDRLIVRASSDNGQVAVTAGGTGADRVVYVVPAAGFSGTARITVSVSDGVDATATSFVVTVGEAPPPLPGKGKHKGRIRFPALNLEFEIELDTEQ